MRPVILDSRLVRPVTVAGELDAICHAVLQIVDKAGCAGRAAVASEPCRDELGISINGNLIETESDVGQMKVDVDDIQEDLRKIKTRLGILY
jgi:hypothetical protein